MDKYNLTVSDIEDGIKRFLTDTYVSTRRTENPSIYYIVGGPGAGKTGIETYIKRLLKERGETSAIVNSDKIAEFHPDYDEILENELPEDCYKYTRQFVRPASPRIFEDLSDKKINIINENTFDKGESDIDLVRKFKQKGYRISINIMATDILESRLSCFEREAAMLKSELTPRGISEETQKRMYNSFMKEIETLQVLGLCDELNVYSRGININKPNLIYSLGARNYQGFREAIETERKKQRDKILSDPSNYLLRIEEAIKVINEYGTSDILTKNSIAGLNTLKRDLFKELGNETKGLNR